MSNEDNPATSPTPNLPVQFYLMRHKYANDDKQDRLVMRFSDGKMVIVQNHGTKTAASHYDDEAHLNERWGVQSGNWGFYEYMLLESGAVNAMQEKIANLGQYKHNAMETIGQYIADASTMSNELEELKEKLRIVENENKNVEGEYKLSNEKWREAKETIKNKDLLISALYESLKEAGVSEDVLKQYFTYGRMENLPEIVNQLSAPYKKRAKEAESNVHAAIDKSNSEIAKLNQRNADQREMHDKDTQELRRSNDAFNESNKKLASRLQTAVRGLKRFGLPNDKVDDIVLNGDPDRMSNYVGNHIASGALLPEGVPSRWEKKVRKLTAKVKKERAKNAALKAKLEWMKSATVASVFPPDYRLPITDPAIEDVIEHFKSMPPGASMLLPAPEDPAATILRLLENQKIRLGRDGRLRVIPD